MRYVIVSVVNGEAGEFNNELRRELFNKFKSKSSKLPAHFTIKAPFEYDGDIDDLEKCIESVCSNEKATPYKIQGYDHFGDRVIYMKVIMSEEGKSIHNKLIDKMSIIPYIEFTKSDGKDKIFHVTLASKKICNIYKKLWDYINEYPCKFTASFDNVCIYKWENNTWNLYREFKF